MSEKLESIPDQSTDTINIASIKDSAALARNQARIHNIQTVQKRNRELRDKYGITLPDGRGIKSASAISSVGKPNTTKRHSATDTPQIVDLSGDPDAKDLGGTFGEDFGSDTPRSLKPWETAKGEKGPQYKTEEFKNQWFTDQMKELGYNYDPKYYFHAYTADYKKALTMAESNWKAMNKEWDTKYAESTKQHLNPVEQPATAPTTTAPTTTAPTTTAPTTTAPTTTAPTTTAPTTTAPTTTASTRTSEPRILEMSAPNQKVTVGDGKSPLSQRSIDAFDNFLQGRISAQESARRSAAVGKRVAGTDNGVFMSNGDIYFGNPDQNPDKRKSRGALV